MEKKKEFRVLIKHYFLREKTIKETEEKLRKYFPESAPSHGMICKWFSDFKNGHMSTDDAERPGPSFTVTTPEMVNKIFII